MTDDDSWFHSPELKEIYHKLDNTDGILSILVTGPESETGPAIGPMALQGCAIDLVRASNEDYVTVLLGEKGSAQRKLIACIWPKFHIAVEVVPGHGVNKSLQRILRRVGRRYGGLEVESRPRRPRAENPPCANEPPAASSDDPTTAPSSPSPGDTTPTTGGSPEAQ